MRYRVLGPLQVCSATGAEIPVRSRLERTLLAVLLVRAGQTVGVGQLVEALWAGRPPSSHASNLQTYVSRLRDRLPGVDIAHAQGGYRLTVADDELDLARFRHEIATARAVAAAGDAGRALGWFRAALGRWRGPMLDGLTVPLLGSDIAHCERERLDAAEDRAAAELDAGTPGVELLAELTALVAEHPLRERLHGLLMVALCRAGRRADALGAYRHARATLVADLGIEPGAELQRVHRGILAGADPFDHPLDDPSPRTAPDSFPVCQLPPAPDGFIGRGGLLDTVAGHLRPGPVVPVVALAGQPGVGKSAVALVVAHRLRAEFPDGQIFIDLAGGSARPLAAATALADVLRSLGVPGPAVPDDVGALSAAYRAKLADRRLLVVLDDAADPAQIRPLLPGTPGSAVLVTSRRQLSGLVVARHVPVDPLTDPEARALLAHVVGGSVVAGAPGPASRIAAACGNLPLALRIAGTRLATRGLTPETLARRLGDERRRLTELAVGDQRVRASIAFSVEALSAPARAAFAALGLVGPRSVASWTIGALLDAVSPADVESTVDELVEACLLTPVGPGPDGEPRYRLHDLLRLYAEGIAPASPVPLASLVTTALALCDVAATHLPRTVLWARTSTPAPAGAVHPDTAERVRAGPGDWFDAETDLLVDLVLPVADEPGVLALAERLAPALWSRGRWGRLRDVLTIMEAAAHRLGAEAALARAGLIDGILRLVRGEVPAAAARFAASRARYERIGDGHGLACVLSDQAVLSGYQEYTEEALNAAFTARDLFLANDDPLGAVIAAPPLSAALRGLGRFPQARKVDREAVAGARALAAPDVVLGRCLNSLAVSNLLAGRTSAAYDAAAEAVTLLRPSGDRYVQLAALRQLATAAAGLGRRAEAVRLLRESRELALELGDRLGGVSLDRDLAVSRIGDGDPSTAVAELERCLRAFEEMDIPSGQAATLVMLARAYDELGRAEDARRARRRRAEVRIDPRDGRTPLLADIMLRLADRQS